jgi:hypothetical protein
MMKNKPRELLTEGQARFGTRVITFCPGIIEVISHSGAFDYIEEWRQCDTVAENIPMNW